MGRALVTFGQLRLIVTPSVPAGLRGACLKLINFVKRRALGNSMSGCYNWHSALALGAGKKRSASWLRQGAGEVTLHRIFFFKKENPQTFPPNLFFLMKLNPPAAASQAPAPRPPPPLAPLPSPCAFRAPRTCCPPHLCPTPCPEDEGLAAAGSSAGARSAGGRWVDPGLAPPPPPAPSPRCPPGFLTLDLPRPSPGAAPYSVHLTPHPQEGLLTSLSPPPLGAPGTVAAALTLRIPTRSAPALLEGSRQPANGTTPGSPWSSPQCQRVCLGAADRFHLRAAFAPGLCSWGRVPHKLSLLQNSKSPPPPSAVLDSFHKPAWAWILRDVPKS